MTDRPTSQLESRLTMLSDEKCQMIYDAALTIISEIGMTVPHAEAREILVKGAGATVEGEDLVKIPRGPVQAPRLAALMADPAVTKIFHFARFDLAALYNAFGVMPQPVYCTKIASRLSRTYTDRHGLKDLVREVLNVDLSKQQQSSDWGAQTLSEPQLSYAASDVLHLHGLRERLDGMLAREGRLELAQACFGFLPWRARLDLQGWDTEDIFAHS